MSGGLIVGLSTFDMVLFIHDNYIIYDVWYDVRYSANHIIVVINSTLYGVTDDLWIQHVALLC